VAADVSERTSPRGRRNGIGHAAGPQRGWRPGGPGRAGQLAAVPASAGARRAGAGAVLEAGRSPRAGGLGRHPHGGPAPGRRAGPVRLAGAVPTDSSGAAVTSVPCPAAWL